MSTWQPTASLNHLRAYAALLKKIRAFFEARDVLEVHTPALSQHTVTDPYIESFTTTYQIGATQRDYFLQTSPEYAMKRLLAADSGPIYQICKAFRNGETGHQHNPEFTMLEWYRPGFTHHELMDEMDALLQTVLACRPAQRITYRDLFLNALNIDPHTISLDLLKQSLTKNHIDFTDADTVDRDSALQLLLTHCIEPTLGLEAPVFLYDFPESQAALSRIREDDPPVAERFEVYIDGVELANGFHELADPDEQLKRFQQNNAARQARQKPRVEIDSHLIAALQHGLPSCAGVALGMDRLLMCQLNTRQIQDVLAFPWERA